jgi:tripartite-type tricarboxylate transporter receptor subunit TctC
VTSASRTPLAPQFPPIAEEGVPGFDVTSWYGIFAPTRTPQAIVRKMNADAVAAIRDPVIKSRLDKLGVSVIASTPEELGAFLKREMDKWGPVIKEAGIKGTG